MNMNQVEAALAEIFNTPLKDWEKRKIVFWVDTNHEFIDDIKKLNVDGVKVHILTDRNQFYTKHLLEEEDLVSSYLIYTNLELDVEENWLADTVFYSTKFYADRVSLLLDNLDIDSAYKQVIQKHQRFFNNQERIRKFKAFGIETYSEEVIELAIMSVLCNVRTPNFEAVLKAVLMDTLDDEENKYLSELTRFFDLDIFWDTVERQYGYVREVKTLKTFFIHLTVTALSHAIDEKYLENVAGFIAERNRTNALVFIDHWMHHKTDYPVYETYAGMAEQEIGIPAIIQPMPVDEFKQADTFPYFDRAIIMNIANSLGDGLEDYEEYIKLIKLRRAKHYYEKYKPIYNALYYTVKMHKFYKAYRQCIPQGLAIDMYQAYIEEYHKMDTYYRKFYVAYDEESNHDLMKKLKELVERLYTNWYMSELSSHWSQAVRSEMTKDWTLPGIHSQQRFYNTFIEPHTQKNERAFVIISDALRYEAGVELAERLQSETIGVCELHSLLGVVPSVTKLGMASLLPHKTLDFDAGGQVLVDGQSTAGIDNRQKIIASAVEESIAVHFDDVTAMNKIGRRETFRGKKLIYIYHDAIDAVGDQAATELHTFDAVERAIDQLYDLVKIIRDDLSGTNIYITADHGFLYQRDALEESDKILKEEMETIESKRRYILSKENREMAGQLAIDLSSVVKNGQGLTAYVPNATMRYRMQGTGVNFVHGGASLQEVVVPLISFKNRRAGQRGVQALEKVDIRLTSTTRRITNSIFSLDFFQTENVGDKMLPRTVKAYMADEKGAVLSDEAIIIGDRSVENAADRTFKIQFAMKSITYDRAKTYYLIIQDAETDVITEKVPFSINLGFVSDFDF